jgi:hypothetical protein
MRLLICGSRSWQDGDSIRDKLLELRPTLVIHGHHWSGADFIADAICHELGIPVLPFPARWRDAGRAAGPLRNQRMIDEGKPDQVLAFHSLKKSRGTADLIRRATKAGIPTKIVWAKR